MLVAHWSFELGILQLEQGLHTSNGVQGFDEIPLSFPNEFYLPYLGAVYTAVCWKRRHFDCAVR